LRDAGFEQVERELEQAEMMVDRDVPGDVQQTLQLDLGAAIGRRIQRVGAHPPISDQPLLDHVLEEFEGMANQAIESINSEFRTIIPE